MASGQRPGQGHLARLRHHSLLMSPAFAAFVAVLTVFGWGGGELIGHGVNRYLTRRSVKRWLEAEARWKRYEKRHRVEAGKPSRGPMPKPRPRVTPGCRPGMQCWQGCDNCRPRSLQAIGAYNCPVTGLYIERYKEDIAPGRVRFSEYAGNGKCIREWVESGPVRWGRTGET